MAFLNFQWSKMVLLTIVLLKSFITSDALRTTPNEQETELAKAFREQNKHFDIANVRTEPFEEISEEIRDQNTTNKQSQNEPTDEEKIRIQQRSAGNTPWHCDSQINWKDLGNLRYPRFVKEVDCLGDSCMHGFYTCRPEYYPLRVLSAREEWLGDNEGDNAMHLPQTLRRNWTFMDVQASIGCMCRN